MKATIWTQVSCIALAAGLASVPVRSLAQATTNKAQPASQTQIEEVVVTARKREETALSAPVSVTALSERQIERQAVLNMHDIALRTPSLQVENNTSSGGGSIYLRGIGTNVAVAGSLEQSVSLDIDGAPIARGNAIRVGQYDLSQIQILKGPQALFFGKNSPAGVIAFRSKDPTSEFDALAKLSYEPYSNNRFAEMAVSGPVTNSLGARLFVHVSDTDGEKENLSRLALPANQILPGAVVANPNGHAWTNKETFVRGTVVFQPNDRFKARLTASYDMLKGEGSQAFPELAYCPQGKPQTTLVAAFLLGANPFSPNFASPNLGPLASALAVDDCKMNGKIYAGGISPAYLTAPGTFSQDPAGVSRSSIKIGAAELSYKITPNIDLTSVTTFARIEAKDTSSFTWGPAAIPLITYNNYALQSQFTQEFRATTKFSSPLNFMVGGFYEDAHFDTYSQNSAIPPYVFMFYHIPNRVYSGFAQAIWDVTPTIELAAGVRQTREDKRLDMTRVGVPQPTADAKAKFNNTSPEATLTWRPSTTLTVYTAYKTGFKSGGYANTLTAPNPAPVPTTPPLLDFLFQPEKSEGFEAGVKAELFDRTLRVDATAYSYKYTNLQVSNYTVNNGIPVQEVLNAASARQKGIEVDAAYYPPAAPGLQLSAMGNYNDSHYLHFVSPCFAGQAISEGCDLIFNPATQQFTSQDLSGRQFTNAPKWVGSVGLSYSRPIGGMRLEVGSDASFRSSYNASSLLSPGGVQRKSATLSAQVRLISDDGSWELGVFGKNLTNVYRSSDGGEVPLTGNSTATGTVNGGQNARADLEALTNPGRQVFVQLVVHPGLWRRK
jgi:iron complex outermembrane receptor protein